MIEHIETYSKDRNLQDLHDYAWKYFQLHAEQRLKIFQFFIALATAIVAASVYLIRFDNNSFLPALLGGMLVLLSFVFWKLDNRTKRLVWNGEEALKYIDKQLELPATYGIPHVLSIVEKDDHFTKHKKPKYPFFGYYNYGRCFRYIFCGFGSFGFLLIILGAYKFLHLLDSARWLFVALCSTSFN